MAADGIDKREKRRLDRSVADQSSTQKLVDVNGNHFPSKLYRMLLELESDPNHDGNDIIAWKPHGRCFVIRDETRFIEEIMKK